MTGPGMYLLHIIIWLCSYFMPSETGTWELNIAGNTAMILEKKDTSYLAKQPGSEDMKNALIIKIKGARISLTDSKKREQSADMVDFLPIEAQMSEKTVGQIICQNEESDLCVASLSVSVDKVEIGFKNGGATIPLILERVDSAE